MGCRMDKLCLYIMLQLGIQFFINGKICIKFTSKRDNLHKNSEYVYKGSTNLVQNQKNRVKFPKKKHPSDTDFIFLYFPAQ